MDSMMPGKGQVRRTTRLEPGVGGRQAKPPVVNHDMAGRPMSSAAEGVAVSKGQIMHTAIPSFVGFTKAPWNKDRLMGQTSSATEGGVGNSRPAPA